MRTTYCLNASELDQTFLEGLRTTFPGKEIEIVVYELDETDYLLKSDANRLRLLTAKDNLEKGENLAEVSLQDME